MSISYELWCAERRNIRKFARSLSSSVPEQYIGFYLQKAFAENLEYQKRFDWLGYRSLDIYVPSLKLAIEYDGEYYHTERRYLDNTKTNICKEHGIVFITQIGKRLNSGMLHDGRAPDYDDWELNGDILIWYPLLNRAVEISSMGIRVDAESLAHQLKVSGCEDRKNLPFHKMLLDGELPLTVGGGIGQSRICMLMLAKAHIGEVQSSAWSDDMIAICEKNNIILL